MNKPIPIEDHIRNLEKQVSELEWELADAEAADDEVWISRVERELGMLDASLRIARYSESIGERWQTDF